MASPQRENGHVDLANEIADHLMKIRIPGEERQIFDCIMRQTWGYCKLRGGKPYKDKKGLWVKKKWDAISQTQFVKFTGINRRRVWSLIQELLDKNLIVKNDDGFICKYAIQKDWEKWKLSSKKVTVQKDKFKEEVLKPLSKETVVKKGDSSEAIENRQTVVKKGDDPVVKNDAHKRKDTKEKRKEQPIQTQRPEVDKLIQIYKKTYPEHIQVFKIGSIIKMRDLISLAMAEGIGVEAIEERIKEAKTGTPWKIIDEKWRDEEKKEEETIKKLRKLYGGEES